MVVALILVGAVLGALLVERLFEIALHRAHMRSLSARGAIVTRDDGFGMIVAVQVLLFVGLAIEALAAPWTASGWWTWAALAGALVAQLLRYWAIATLGSRWTVRVVTLPRSQRILGGPYRWLRHPNYVAVALETLTLPLAFLAWGTLAIVLPFNLIALARRIRREDRALDAAGFLPARDIA